MTRPRISTRSAMLVLAEITRHERMTARDLCQRLSRTLKPSSIGAALRVLRDNNQIYICDWKNDGTSRMPIYAVGDAQDVPYVRVKEGLAESSRDMATRFVPHPDPAAAWMRNPIVMAAGMAYLAFAHVLLMVAFELGWA